MAHPRDLDPSASPRALFGYQLRALRTAAGMSQQTLGDLLHFSADAIATWETGRSLPDEATVVSIDDILNARGLLVASWRYAASTRQTPDSASDSSTIGASTSRGRSTMGTHPADVEDELNEHADTAADFGTWAEQLAGGDIAIERLRQRTRRLAAQALTEPPAIVAAEAGPLAREVFDLAKKPHRPNTARELYQISAGLCSLMAWLAGDLGNLDAAEMQARAALVCAETADDPAATAWALVAGSKTAFWHNDYPRALRLAERGAGLRAPGTAGVMLACQAADAHAKLGNTDGVRTALRHAVDAAERAVGADPIGGLFSCAPGRAANYAAVCLLALGDTTHALAECDRGIAEFRLGGYGFGTVAQTYVTRAEAQLLAGEIDGAVVDARHVLELPAERRLATVSERLRSLADYLNAPRFASSTVANPLREEILEYCAPAAPRPRLTAGPEPKELM